MAIKEVSTTSSPARPCVVNPPAPMPYPTIGPDNMARLTQEEMIEVDLAIVPMVEWSGGCFEPISRFGIVEMSSLKGAGAEYSIVGAD
jgi:hypothetical protein